ncbi:RNA polymerase sigma-70 factor [Niabella aquatica]
MEQNIKELARLIAEQDDQLAFAELYRHYLPGLLSFVDSIVKDRQQAEEIVLEVFTKLWENRKTITEVKSLSSYLYTACKYTSISFLRKQKHWEFDEITESASWSLLTPESQLISKENQHLINDAINNLPAKCRLIFRLVKEEKLMYTEVAELLDISVKTVEAQVYIATRKLIEILKKPFPGIRSGSSGKKNV